MWICIGIVHNEWVTCLGDGRKEGVLCDGLKGSGNGKERYWKGSIKVWMDIFATRVNTAFVGACFWLAGEERKVLRA